MKWLLIATAALCISTQAAHASSCVTDYPISFAIPDSSGVNVPPALVTGNICTDGTTGTLAGSNIVSWNLTLSNTWNTQTPDFTLSSADAGATVDLYLSNASSQLSATADQLTWNFQDLNPGVASLSFSNSTKDYIALYDYSNLFIDYSYGNQSVANYGPTESGIVNLTPVPEPASLVLLTSGIIGLGFVRRRQEHPAQG